MKDTLDPTSGTTPRAVAVQAAGANSASNMAGPHGAHQPQDFQEIWAWTAEHKRHDLQQLRVFLELWGFGPAAALSLSSEAPDKITPAPRAFGSLLEWFDTAFPKSHRGLHPRLDLGVSLERYKKVREGVRRSIRGCMGAYEARAERDAMLDGWAELLGLLQPLSEDKGPLSKQSFSLLKTFSDIARRAKLEPWCLTGDRIRELEEVFVAAQDRALSQRAIKTLNTWAGIVEFGDLLPAQPIPALPARRVEEDLPDHVSKRIEQLVNAAATRIDLNTSKAHLSVGATTKAIYRAALRYHVKLLPHCPPDPDTAYDQPVSDLTSVNDVDALFAPEHVSAAIRATDDREHLPSAPQADTALSYFKTLCLVLERSPNAFPSEQVADIRRRIASSDYFRGVDRDEMPEHIQDWCRALLNTPEKERRFHNLHRIFQAKADAIMKSANNVPEALSEKDRARGIRLGVCAAVCAIELTGRPLRLRNAIWLRHRGRRANINPSAGWEFFIPAEEAKNGKRIPEISLRADRMGPQVLDWYLKHIRPLIDPQGQSIYLFPSIRTPGGRMHPSTFRQWFQAAANDAGIPMTFHKFRHGFACILIRMGQPLQSVADMLGNSRHVCAKRYAFIDPDRSAKQAQDAIAQAAADLETDLHRRGRK